MPYIGKQPANVPVTADDIPANSIDASKIIDGAITIADIADDAVTADKLANSINTDIATGVTGNTTANNALPKAGGTITGVLTIDGGTAYGNIEVGGDSGAHIDLKSPSSDDYDGRILTTGSGLNITTHTGVGSVNLQHENNTKLSTSSTGIDVTGAVTATSFAGSGASLTGLTSSQMPAGSVLQVVYATITSGSVTTTSTSYADTNVTASITPTSSSSKILIQANAHTYISSHAANDWSAANFDIVRGSTQVYQTSPSPTGGYTMGSFVTDTTSRHMDYVPITYLDSPSTTSAVTYKVRVASRNGHSVNFSSGYGHSNITLTEIAG